MDPLQYIKGRRIYFLCRKKLRRDNPNPSPEGRFFMRNFSKKRKPFSSGQFSRREFLQTLGLVTAGSFLAGCKPQNPESDAPGVRGPRPLEW